MHKVIQLTLRTTLAVVLILIAGPVFGQICVELDLAKDSLPSQEAKSAAGLLSDTFGEEGEETMAPPCTDRYRLYHVKFGNAYTVVVSGSLGTRKLRVGNLEDIPSAYSQIVRSLLSGEDIDTASNAITRDNVTQRQEKPRRVKADSLYYFRLGPGYTAGADPFVVATALGFGYRYELDSMGVDASLSLSFDTGADEESAQDRDSGATLSSQLMGLFFLDPKANSTSYLGAGIGYGGATFYREDRPYSGGGLQAQLALGYEFLRASTIRLFVELGATLPFWTATPENSDESIYTPIMSLSLGVGWARRVRGVFALFP